MQSVIALTNVPSTSVTDNCRYVRAALENSIQPAISLIFFAMVSQKKAACPDWKLGAPLLIFFLAFGIDGSNSYLYLLKTNQLPACSIKFPNLYIPNNTFVFSPAAEWALRWLPSFIQRSIKVSGNIPIQDRALSWKKLGILTGIVIVS